MENVRSVFEFLYKRYITDKTEDALITRNKYLLRGNKESNASSKLPYINILNERVTNTVKRGVYIVCLLSEDSQTIYLTLNQGCDSLSKEIKQYLLKRAEFITEFIDKTEFEVGTIKLGTELKGIWSIYEYGNICCVKYTNDNVPNEEKVLEDLRKLLESYDIVVENKEKIEKEFPEYSSKKNQVIINRLQGKALFKISLTTRYKSFAKMIYNEALCQYIKINKKIIVSDDHDNSYFVHIIDQEGTPKRISKLNREMRLNIKKDDCFILCDNVSNGNVNTVQKYGKIIGDEWKELDAETKGRLDLDTDGKYYSIDVEFICDANGDIGRKRCNEEWIKAGKPGNNYSWLPDSGSCISNVPEEHYALFDKVVFQPYFGCSIKDKGFNYSEKDVNNIVESDKEGEKNMSNLNIILYGPPGTGKTYNTVKMAVDICDKSSGTSYDSYNEYLTRYKQLVEEGRIAFITFHQSYGYEEFIEGIKPVMDSGEQDSEGDVKYDIVDGVFKKFCDIANKNRLNSNKNPNVITEEKIIKEKVRRFLDEAIDNNRKIDLASGQNSFVVSYYDEDKNIIGIVPEDGKLGKLRLTNLYNVIEKIDVCDSVSKIKNFFNVKRTQQQDSYYYVLAKAIVSVEYNLPENDEAENMEPLQPYVFIIDEINRGNISKIFGELITLIEPSKRLGEDEAMSVKLPYSAADFGVPNNVHIIGTMNTADRSIALMDTALRRRFEFVEMMPNITVLNDVVVRVGEKEVDVKKMLQKINARIEYLYDREHTIGHAYFTKLLKEENRNIDVLSDIFKNKIIPLLQEYFYDDYKKIQLVLGDNAKPKQFKLIKEEKLLKSLFWQANTDLDDDKVKYSLNIEYDEKGKVKRDAFKDPQSYIYIYDEPTKELLKTSEEPKA